MHSEHNLVVRKLYPSSSNSWLKKLLKRSCAIQESLKLGGKSVLGKGRKECRKPCVTKELIQLL